MPLAGTQGASFPFWSPDAAYVGFFANGKLQKIAVSGGTPQALASVLAARGGSWGSRDVIIYAPDSGSAIWRINADGSGATTAPDAADAGGPSTEPPRSRVRLIAFASGAKLHGNHISTGELVPFVLVMLLLGVGMWQRSSWAVLPDLGQRDWPHGGRRNTTPPSSTSRSAGCVAQRSTRPVGTKGGNQVPSCSR